MTACHGQARGLQDHDARHVSARLEIPWTDRPAQPVRVVVVHRCEQYGCPLRGMDREEDARNPDAVLRKVLEPRGMLGCSHVNGEPSGFKGCLPACRVYPSPERNGATGSTYVHAPGCPHGYQQMANGHLEVARQAFMNGHPPASMNAVRDAPRPQPGTITSDPDAFLERATRRRPETDGRTYG